ncbi:MAG: hypothetical protein K8L99_16690 [Anaerolineae bacterium]|nr:hypothetical protein [Anaerolineae bacterium]
MDNFEKRLMTALDRWDCPTPDVLGDYHLGLADAEVQAAIDKHLEICPLCRRELQQLEAFLADDQAVTTSLPPSLHEGSFVEPTRREAAQLALRGDSDEPLTFILADDVTLYLMIEKMADSIALNGQLAASEQAEADFQGALVEIWQAEQLEATAFIDEAGTFSATLPGTGTTLIRIQPNQRSTLTCRLEM